MRRGNVDSPFGPISFLVEDGHLAHVQFAEGPSDDADAEINETARQLAEYYLGKRHAFDL